MKEFDETKSNPNSDSGNIPDSSFMSSDILSPGNSHKKETHPKAKNESFFTSAHPFDNDFFGSQSGSEKEQKLPSIHDVVPDKAKNGPSTAFFDTEKAAVKSAEPVQEAAVPEIKAAEPVKTEEAAPQKPVSVSAFDDSWVDSYYAKYGSGAKKEKGKTASEKVGKNTADNGEFSEKSEDAEHKDAKRAKSSRSFGFRLFAAAMALTLVFGACGMAYSLKNGFVSNKTKPASVGPSGFVANISVDTTEEGVTVPIENEPIAHAIDASNVFNTIRKSSVGIIIADTETKAVISEGSGIAIGTDSSGEWTYFATCAHVVDSENSTALIKNPSNGKEYTARIMGYDLRTDIAVLAVMSKDFTIAKFADSSTIRVGQNIYAIGNPGGSSLENTFTSGVISAESRTITAQNGYKVTCIQHCAPVNPGNSGGALCNENGEVIGMNSMKIISSEYEGIGFAIPSNTIIDVSKQLIAMGYVPGRPYLGISYTEAQSDLINYVILKIKNYPLGAIQILSFSESGAFAGTKLQKGDIVIAVNGKALTDSSILTNIVDNSAIGDKITFTVIRVDKDYNITKFKITTTVMEDKGTYSVTTTEEKGVTESYSDTVN